MTVLAAPPVIAERQTSNHDCGPACLASILQWTGRTDTEVDVAAWMTAHGVDSGGTTAYGLGQYLNAHGLAYQWDAGNAPMSTYVPAALDRGHLVVGLHQCNGNAEPVPRGTTNIAHWRVFYADDVGVYRTMNPWPPELETLYQVTFDAADLRNHVEVMVPAHAPEIQMTPEQAAQLNAIYLALFAPYENSTTVGAPWNNPEIIRRQLADLGAPYSPSTAVPFTPTPVTPGSGLTAAQAAALAAIPGIVTTLAAIQAKLNKDLA